MTEATAAEAEGERARERVPEEELGAESARESEEGVAAQGAAGAPIYLLYQYKSTNTDAEGSVRGGGCSAAHHDSGAAEGERRSERRRGEGEGAGERARERARLPGTSAPPDDIRFALTFLYVCVCVLASWLYEGIKVLDLKTYYLITTYYLRPYDILLRTCCAAPLRYTLY